MSSAPGDLQATVASRAAADRHRLQRPRRRPGERGAEILAGAAGLGLTITIVLTLRAESLGGLGAPGGIATALGRLTGMVGAYLMLVVVLLAARLPALERAAGQDTLVRWHRRLGPWPLVLVAAHGALVAAGYAQQAHTGVVAQVWALLTEYPGVLAATAGLMALLAAGVTSCCRVRRRMAYDIWWAVHLYMYLGLALAFSHQIATGASFVGHPVARTWWIALWGGTAGAVLVFRVGVPLYRSLRHRLVVTAVHREGPDVVSIVSPGAAGASASSIPTSSTGSPPGGVLSVTCVGPDLAVADALATAAFAMGHEGAAWIARQPDVEGMVIGADRVVRLTPGFPALLAGPEGAQRSPSGLPLRPQRAAAS